MSSPQMFTTGNDLFPAEKYFSQLAEKLNILSPLPELPRIQSVLEKNMPERVERFVPRLSDPRDPSQWLSLILKMNFLIRLWKSDSEPVLVGLNVNGSLNSCVEQLEKIQTPEFCSARQELGIANHWFVVIPGLHPVIPMWDELLDALYRQLEFDVDCGIITF